MEDTRTSAGRLPAMPRLATAIGLPLAVALAMGALVVFAEEEALVIALSLVACVFVMLDFRFGVACLVILMPLSASTIFPHSMAGVTGLNPINLLVMVTCASMLAHGLPEGGWARFAPRPVIWFYLVPLAAAGLLGMRHAGEIPSDFNIAALIAFDSPQGYLRDILLKPALLVLFALILGAAVARSRRPEGFLLPMMVSVWVMGGLAIAYFHFSGASLAEASSATDRGFLSPLGLHANDLGRYYAVAYALMLFTAAATRDYKLKLALGASIAMLVVALTLTFSRSAFFGFLLVSVVFLLSHRRFGTVLLGAAALAALVWMAPPAVFERIELGWGEGLNAISAGRVDDIWLPLLPEIWQSPIWGHGLASTLWSEATRSGRIPLVGHPHNAYLATLLDMGIVGLGLMGAYYLHLWNGFRRLSRDATLSAELRGFFTGAAVGLATFLVAGMSGSSLSPAPEQFYLWFAVGMMYGLVGRPDLRVVQC
ncbi:MAG TPA: O-antigen ligase family protein [Rhodocyclaceae bacterium]